MDEQTQGRGRLPIVSSEIVTKNLSKSKKRVAKEKNGGPLKRSNTGPNGKEIQMGKGNSKN